MGACGCRDTVGRDNIFLFSIYFSLSPFILYKNQNCIMPTGTINPLEHQDEHDMFSEMRLRLWKARGLKERFVRFILRYIVPLTILITLSLAFLVEAYATLLT